ncbi:unnamed protein product [Linum trigynum]|uniref:Uncharacterized protein n=1 Tax=Linum trigynum TaxID=586398 RepID=A0AAV2DBK1_9ROSI
MHPSDPDDEKRRRTTTKPPSPSRLSCPSRRAPREPNKPDGRWGRQRVRIHQSSSSSIRVLAKGCISGSPRPARRNKEVDQRRGEERRRLAGSEIDPTSIASRTGHASPDLETRLEDKPSTHNGGAKRTQQRVKKTTTKWGRRTKTWQENKNTESKQEEKQQEGGRKRTIKGKRQKKRLRAATGHRRCAGNSLMDATIREKAEE